MALTFTTLTSGEDNVNRTSYTSASVTVTAGTLVAVSVNASVASGAANEPTVTGPGTLTLLDSAARAQPQSRMTKVFIYSVDVGGTGSFTIAGDSWIGAIWAVTEIAGQDTTTPLVQKIDNGTNSGTSGSATFLTALTSGNAVFSTTGIVANEAITQGNGATELIDLTHGAPLEAMSTAYHLAPSVSEVASSWTSSVGWRIFGWEIAPSTGGGGTIPSGSASGSYDFTGSATGDNGEVGPPAFVGYTFADGEAATSYDLTLPTGTVAGDAQLVFAMVSSSSETITAPAGWTQILNDVMDKGDSQTQQLYVFQSTTDTGTATFTKSGGLRDCHLIRAAWTEQSSIGTGAVQQNTVASTTHAVPGVTTTADNSLVIGMVFSEDIDGQVHTEPAGWTKQVDREAQTDDLAICVAEFLDTTAGAVSGSFTTGTSVQSQTYSIVLHGAAFTPSGSATGGYDYAGSATGTAPLVDTAAGSASGGFDFSGSATGSRSAAGAASGGFDYAGSASGSTARSGAAAGGYDYTGSATGTQPTGVSNGSATGGYDFTGSATGVAPGTTPASGSATGSFQFAGAATGSAPKRGSASGGYSFTGSATGERPIAKVGTALGGFDFTGAATGSRASRGSASGTFVFTGTEVTGRAPLYAFRFIPPTYQQETVPPALTRRPRYALTESLSVIRIDGILTQWKTPTARMLEDAGDEGVDYFIGGHVYQVTKAVSDELVSLGYSTERIQE